MGRWLLIFASITGCSEDLPPAPVPSSPAPAVEPTIAALVDLPTPPAGHAQVAFPTYRAERSAFEHPVRDLAGKHGRGEMVAQILMGEDAESGLMLTFYGERLTPGTYRVLPATDEVRIEHAGLDSRVFTATLGQGAAQGDLRSESGSVVIDAAGEAVVGTIDAVLRSRNNLRETQVRARFHALPDQFLDALLEHQDAIRQKLGKRR